MTWRARWASWWAIAVWSWWTWVPRVARWPWRPHIARRATTHHVTHLMPIIHHIIMHMLSVELWGNEARGRRGRRP